MKKFSLIASVVLLSFTASAAPAKSEKQANSAVQFRQALFQLIRSNVGPLGGMAKGAIPFDKAVMEKNAIRIEQLSAMIADYYETDTSASKVESASLDRIWQNKADFDDKAANLNQAALFLRDTAKSGNEADYRKAVGRVFKGCKGCHDEYKAD